MADEPAQPGPAPERPARTPQEVIARLEAQLRRIPNSRSFEKGVVRYNLGLAYLELPTGSRPLNLTRAAGSLEEATRLFDPAAKPIEHARTQNALGIALRELKRLEDAVEAFRAAGELISPELNPQEHGAAINNLALTLTDMGRQDEAIEPFMKALDVFTGKDSIQQRINVLVNLGQALAASGDPARIRQGIARFKEALDLADPQEYPYQWALAYHSMGAAYTATGEPREAAEAFRQALRVYTRTRFPFQYALAKNNLGLSFAQIGDVPALRRAVVAYVDALRMLDVRVHREQWEGVYRNLELAEQALVAAGAGGTRGEHFALLAAELDEEELVTLMRERLSEFTLLPEPGRTEALSDIDRAVLELPYEQAERISGVWMRILMELPHDQFLAGLTARMSVHTSLDGDGRRRSAEILEHCMDHELLAPQRIRVRDTLYEMGYERPEEQ